MGYTKYGIRNLSAKAKDNLRRQHGAKKERLGIEFDRRRLEERIRKVKDVLPLAEQLTRFRIGIGEVLAFHSAVYEKTDMEKIPLDVGAYRIAEDLRYYRQLGGLKKEQNKATQHICMLNDCSSHILLHK